MTNPFSGTGYDLAAMTAAVNKLPNLYNRTASIFSPEGITTTTLLVEQKDGTLSIIASRPRGAAPDKSKADKRSLRSFVIPHIPIEDVLLPEDYQNVRAFGTENGLETAANIMANKLQRMKNAIDQTREHLRIGALKGNILDADASTLYDLYTEFGITAKTVDFALDDEDTDVRGKCAEVIRHIEDKLLGESMTGVRVLVSASFYDDLVAHPKVEKAYQYYMANNINLAGDYRLAFPFGGLVFEEYRGTWTDKDGTARAGITAGEGHAFPEGTGNTFREVFAPGNFIETANTVGLPYYARQEPRKYNAGVDLWVESNPLPICKRPEVLVKVTA
ncbi:MAG: major capsid protein [Bryobacteraceae bacterium]